MPWQDDLQPAFWRSVPLRRSTRRWLAQRWLAGRCSCVPRHILGCGEQVQGL